mmetsp:Transcript_96907/g.289491  ORF Transcript_96907/g.289491 Transcript_96907/m.289491 type:complete len:251 (+) Transcript_96907:535-1287(+)
MSASSMRSSLFSSPRTRETFFSSSSLMTVLMCSRARSFSSSLSLLACSMFSCRTMRMGRGLSWLLRHLLMPALTLPLLFSIRSSMASFAAVMRWSRADWIPAATAMARSEALSPLPIIIWSSERSSGKIFPKSASTRAARASPPPPGAEAASSSSSGSMLVEPSEVSAASADRAGKMRGAAASQGRRALGAAANGSRGQQDGTKAAAMATAADHAAAPSISNETSWCLSLLDLTHSAAVSKPALWTRPSP